jgi:small subunit ribosomal protein S2
MREHIAVKEAQKLNIPIFAMVDTNSDPRPIDFVIPANDDASKSIDIIMDFVTKAVAEGLVERKSDKAADREGDDEDTLVEEVYEEEVAAGYDEEESDEEVAAVEDIVGDEVEEEPVVIPAPKAKKVSAQDLTKIEGIGPKAAEALIKAGIGTYAALADATPEQIKDGPPRPDFLAQAGRNGRQRGVGSPEGMAG